VGCKSLGLSGKRVDYEAGAAQAPSLEVPARSDYAGGDGRYDVPQGDDENVADFFRLQQGRYAATRVAALRYCRK